MPGFLSELERWKVTLIVVDEAHCISEWGQFRSEYRKLSSLRSRFPRAALLALTATATERVRADIITFLQMEKARTYVSSFNRPNLTYRVLPKSNRTCNCCNS